MWTADLLCIVWWCLATLDQLVAVYLKPKFTAVSWFDWDHAAAIIGSIVVHTVDDIMQKWSLIHKSEYFFKENFNPKCSFFNAKMLHLDQNLPLLRTCSPQIVSGGPEPRSSCVTILATTARYPSQLRCYTGTVDFCIFSTSLQISEPINGNLFVPNLKLMQLASPRPKSLMSIQGCSLGKVTGTAKSAGGPGQVALAACENGPF